MKNQILQYQNLLFIISGLLVYKSINLLVGLLHKVIWYIVPVDSAEEFELVYILSLTVRIIPSLLVLVLIIWLVRGKTISFSFINPLKSFSYLGIVLASIFSINLIVNFLTRNHLKTQIEDLIESNQYINYDLYTVLEGNAILLFDLLIFILFLVTLFKLKQNQKLYESTINLTAS